jgi:hypothetical protein
MKPLISFCFLAIELPRLQNHELNKLIFLINHICYDDLLQQQKTETPRRALVIEMQTCIKTEGHKSSMVTPSEATVHWL